LPFFALARSAVAQSICNFAKQNFLAKLGEHTK